MSRSAFVSPLLLGSSLVFFLSGCDPVPVSEPEETVETQAAAAAAAPCTTPAKSAWHLLEAGLDASFRGLSAAPGPALWVSGTGGTVALSRDGGAAWQRLDVPDASELDFRDVDAFDADTAVIMSAGPAEVSRIYRTTDAGTTWTLVDTNAHTEGFYDGIAFWDREKGLLYGDPVDGAFFVSRTENGGLDWQRVPPESLPPALDGEAGFAASGTGVAVAAGGAAFFGTGGPAARVFRSTDHGRTWSVAETPLRRGEGSRGIFSLAFADPLRGVAVGGDYRQPEETAGNAAWTDDGGLTWHLPDTPPTGFRSAVAYVPEPKVPGTSEEPGRVLITLGTNGSDISTDGGRNWQPLDGGGANALAFGSEPCRGWSSGPEGYLARWPGSE